MVSPSFASERGEQDRDEQARCERDRQANLEIRDEDGKCKRPVAGNWWPEFRSTPNLDGVYVGASAIVSPSAQDLTPVWRTPTGGAIFSSPAVANGLVYIGAEEFLFALNASNGGVIWRAPTGQGPSFASSPAVANGLVYIGSSANTVWAFNAFSGGLVWSANVAAPVVSSPALVNNVVLVGSNDGDLHAYDAVKGAELWSSQTGAAVQSSPAVAEGMVYVGSSDHFIYAFAASGDWPMFHHSPTLSGLNAAETAISPSNVGTLVADWTACPTCIVRDPAVANGVVYAGVQLTAVCGDCLAAFDATNGIQLWRTPLTPAGSIRGTPAVWNGVVYIGAGNQRLYAFNAATGTQLWVTAAFGGPVDPPTVQNGLVYAVSEGSSAGIHARDPISGAKVWDALISNVPVEAPAVANENAYAGGASPFTNKLFAYDAILGALLPSWPVTGGADRSAAFGGGKVYWGDTSGTISAFDAISGAKSWTASTAPSSSFIGSSAAVANGMVYVGAGGQVFALDEVSGAHTWSTAVSGTIGPSSPAVANGVLFICSDTSTAGKVQGLNALSGAQLWSATLPVGEGFSSPAIAHGMVYIGGSSGLHAYGLP